MEKIIVIALGSSFLVGMLIAIVFNTIDFLEETTTLFKAVILLMLIPLVVLLTYTFHHICKLYLEL